MFTTLNLLVFISNFALLSLRSTILYGPNHFGVSFGFLPSAQIAKPFVLYGFCVGQNFCQSLPCI